MWKKVDEWGGREVYSCLSSDTKLTGATTGSLCFETDTGAYFELNGTWQQTGSGGAAHVRTAASDVQDSAAWFLAFEDEAADVNDNTVVYESPSDVTMYNHHEFSIYQAPGAGAVEVFISHDGVTYETTAIMLIDRSVNTGEAAGQVDEITTAMGLGNYYFNAKVKMWKLQNKGATTGAVTKVRGSHSVL
jgi:hypothetical protein